MGMARIDEQVQENVMKILVICIQRIGDVLLTTPLIRSLKNAFPNAMIDVLVCQETASILHGNTDVNKIIAIERNSTKKQRFHEIKMLWNQYDISISTIPSDRARIYGWAASDRHYGTYSEKDSFIFKYLMSKSIRFDNINIHTIDMNLKICDLMGISKNDTVVTPKSHQNKDIEKFKSPYAIIHPYPKYKYKEWDKEEWKILINYLEKRGVNVYISGGNDSKEIDYCQALVQSKNTINISGKYSLSEISEIISNAAIYIGIDTSVTHLAAATGVKVIAIYGPTNPVKWGPWPIARDRQTSPIWLRHSQDPQRNSNIILIQGKQSCIPCAEEGCEKHINSESECLTTLKSDNVIQEIDKFLASKSI
jgi:heptosyltransferase-3